MSPGEGQIGHPSSVLRRHDLEGSSPACILSLSVDWSPTKERTARLCRLAYLAGKANSPGEPGDSALIGIIRQSALWRLCRERHKRHTFAVRRLLAWYRDGTDIHRAIDRLSAYLGH